MVYIVVGVSCFLLGVGLATIIFHKSISQIQRNKRKLNAYYYLLNEWLFNLRGGKKADKYLNKYGYKKIAIYGMKELGKQLLQELLDSDICVEYVIDQNPSAVPNGIKGYRPDDELPKVDAIVVTASFYFREIKERYIRQGCDIISIDEIIGYKECDE